MTIRTRNIGYTLVAVLLWLATLVLLIPFTTDGTIDPHLVETTDQQP